jgi:hypothetical protein
VRIENKDIRDLIILGFLLFVSVFIAVKAYAAKNLTLVSSGIIEMRLTVKASDGKAVIYIEGVTYDDQGAPSGSESRSYTWDDLDVPSKANLNNAMRFLSQKFNQDTVDEQSITWEDQ